jgi:hypothetical protein
MSVISGGTAAKPCSSGGSASGSAGSGGIVIAHRSPSRCHAHTEANRSSTQTATPTKPYVLVGSV